LSDWSESGQSHVSFRNRYNVGIREIAVPPFPAARLVTLCVGTPTGRRVLRYGRTCVAILWIVLLAAVPAAAQTGTSSPSMFGGGRLTVAGDGALSISPHDDGYFNYSGEQYQLMRVARFDATMELRLAPRLSLLGGLRVLGAPSAERWIVRPQLLLARIRPFQTLPFQVQAGLVPHVFGSYGRRAYGIDNPLIGLPLGYQYVTSLRMDALPASADDLLRMRGRGWRLQYGVGATGRAPGVPLVDGLRNPAGVQVRAGGRRLEASLGLTSGSLSKPSPWEQGGGALVSGRVAARPTEGLVVGASAARGRFLDKRLVHDLRRSSWPSLNDQRAFGFDVEYSRGYWVLRAEGMLVSWWLPRLEEPFLDVPLRAVSLDLEARYRLRPGLYAAGRAGRLDFNKITGSFGRLSWDAPVSRVEVGAGYSVSRNVVVKAAYQHNWREAGPRTRLGLASAQVSFWF
jgi:hypothetical protein